MLETREPERPFGFLSYSRSDASERSPFARKREESIGQYQIIFEGTRQDVDASIGAITTSLQKLSEDFSLKMIRIQEGSVKITFRGTEDGYKKVQELLKAGTLSDILGINVNSIRWLEESLSQYTQAAELNAAPPPPVPLEEEC